MAWGICLLLILAAFKFALYLHDISIFFILASFLLLIIIILEVYLRIQHNIDNNAIAVKIAIKEAGRENVSAINNVTNNTIINLANEIDKLVGNSSFNMISEINKIKMYLDSKFSGEKELYEELVSFFDNILNYLEDNKKEISDTGEKTNKIIENVGTKIAASKDLQNKIIVLLQQILDFQQDQTNFLKEEISKLKDGHIRGTF